MANEENAAGGEPKAKDKKAAAGKGAGGGKKKAAEPTGPAPKYKREQPPRLKQLYQNQVRAQLSKDFNYSSSMEVPRLVKIALNMGLGRAAHDAKIIDFAVEELKAIAGQAP